MILVWIALFVHGQRALEDEGRSGWQLQLLQQIAEHNTPAQDITQRPDSFVFCE